MGTIPRWTPPQPLTKLEERLLARLGRVRKLLGFLRRHRHQLIDDASQTQLESMYCGVGKEPVAPGLMAMAMLVQSYLGVSDAEMVELTVVDLRVQTEYRDLGSDYFVRRDSAHMAERLARRIRQLGYEVQLQKAV